MQPTAGIDLASEEHRLCVVDGDGCRLEQRRIANSEEGLGFLCRRLLELGVTRVALERPNGLVVDRLLETGIAVVPVHPNQLAASASATPAAAANRTASTATSWPSSPAPTCTVCGCSRPTATRRARCGR